MTPKECEHIAHLMFLAYIGEESTEQRQELSSWLEQDVHNRDLYKTIMDHHRIRSEQEMFILFNRQDAWAKVAQKTYRRRTALFTRVSRYAAVLVLLLTSAVYFLYTDKPKEQIESAELYLEPLSPNAVLWNERNNQIDLSGEIYSVKEISEHEEQLSDSETLRINVPKGGEFELVLDDGTHVWMNSETELVFPRTFKGNERVVELVSGEAYFNVMEDKKKPFIVRNRDLNLTVLGTQFNVHSYPDEENIVTTLVEGALQLSSDNTILRPGEQAIFSKTTRETQVETVDTEVFTSWRHGLLTFKSSRLEAVLKQLSRWYNVKFEYEEEDLKDFIYSGKMKKYENGNVILDILKTTGKVDFIQQDTVIHVKRI